MKVKNKRKDYCTHIMEKNQKSRKNREATRGERKDRGKNNA